ncbi:MAG: hypothetical protein ACRD10_15385, partial [Terriglobia bacterium]
ASTAQINITLQTTPRREDARRRRREMLTRAFTLSDSGDFWPCCQCVKILPMGTEFPGAPAVLNRNQ